MRADFRIAGAVERVEGPLLFLRRTVNVGLNESLHVIGRDGVERLGRVATLDEDSVIVEVLEKTTGLGVRDTVVSMLGEPVCFDVGPNMLGRVFDSIGADTGHAAYAHRRHDHQPGPQGPAERLHRNRGHGHRPDEQPGSRPEIAAVLGRWFAP